MNRSCAPTVSASRHVGRGNVAGRADLGERAILGNRDVGTRQRGCRERRQIDLDGPMLAHAARRGDSTSGVELDLVQLAVAHRQRVAIEAA